MTVFGWQRRRRDSYRQAARKIAQIKRDTFDLELRVRRLEQDSEVLLLRRRRELRDKGIQC